MSRTLTEKPPPAFDPKPVHRGTQMETGVAVPADFRLDGNAGVVIYRVLCRSTCADIGLNLTGLQECLDGLTVTHVIEKSDAMLYAPSVDEIKENCYNPSLICYMLEVEMVFIEEQIDSNEKDASCIFSFIDSRSELNATAETNAGSCPPCEATAIRNSTIFLENLRNVLSKLISMDKRSTL